MVSILKKIFLFDQQNKFTTVKKTRLIWDKIFKNGPSKICGRQPLQNFT